MTYRTFDGTSQEETIVDGRFSSSGDIAISDGSVTQGAIYFADDKNTGIYSPSNDSIAFTTAGSAALTIASDNEATFAGDISGVGITAAGGANNRTGDAVIHITKTNNNDYCLKADAGANGSSNYGIIITTNDNTSHAFSVYNLDDSTTKLYIDGEGDLDTLGHIYVKGGGSDNKFETTSDGAKTTGSLEVTGNVTLGGSLYVPDGEIVGCGDPSNPDIRMYHVAGGDSFIKNTSGNLEITCDEFRLRTVTGTETVMQSSVNGEVQLYWNNDEKFRTTETGCKIRHITNGSESSPHLQIQGSGYYGIHWLDANAYYIGHNSPNRSLRIYSNDESNYVQLAAGGNSWTSSSDERLKEDIQDIGSVIDKVKDIRCISYKRKNIEGARESIGFIAQDFIGKFDQVLDQSKIKDDDDTEYYGIKYTETIPILLKAIQELSTKVETLETEVASLKG